MPKGKTAIAVFWDCLSKMFHFDPRTKEISAKKYVQSYIDYSFNHHSLLETITSNRDPTFTNRLWKELFHKFRTNFRDSMAFNSQTDGQSKETIRSLENFLRPYIECNPHP